MGASDNTTTSTSSSAPTNPQVTATTNNLLSKLDTATNAGVPVFNQSLYVPNGATTQAGQSMALSAANNPLYGQGVNAAQGYANGLIGSGGLTTAQQGLSQQYAGLGGAYDQNSPGYQNVRNKAANDAQTLINSQFNNSGRLGGYTADKALGEGVTNAISSLDYGNYQNNINNRYNSLNAQAGLQQQGVNNAFGASASLPGLFSAGQLPSSIYGAVGAQQDSDAQAKLLAQNDLFQRQAGAPWDTLSRASSILSGAAPNSGTTTTNSTPSPPWYLSALGLGASLL